MAVALRLAKESEVHLFAEAAGREGWNPGEGDAEIYYKLDPDAFFVATVDEEVVGTLSFFRCTPDVYFVGYFTVKEKYRSNGIGSKLWKFAWQSRGCQQHNVVLNAEDHMYSFYTRAGLTRYYYEEGFVLDPLTARYDLPELFNHTISAPVVDEIDLERLADYDQQFTYQRRPEYLKCWINRSTATIRIAKDHSGSIIGYGVIRKAATGFKIAPLFAENVNIAIHLIHELKQGIEDKIAIEAPIDNPHTVTLQKTFSLVGEYKLAKYYSKQPFAFPLERIFSISSLDVYG